jgi:plasmid maintenance system antidote protein VapI
MIDANVVATVRELLDLGLTIRDIAELLRAHPRAIEALIA